MRNQNNNFYSDSIKKIYCNNVKFVIEAIVKIFSYEKVNLFLHENTHHTIPCKKTYFFLKFLSHFIVKPLGFWFFRTSF